ncbi:hypothetical protein SVAN01_07634 [Stagonosporopsis vannaccii]|nr:hypothetical protein SVAN01_07634 [Stagonosporopsis vannaccii]
MTDARKNLHDEDVVMIGCDDISDYNPAQVLPESPEEIKKIRSWLQPTEYAHASGEYRKHLASHMPGTGLWLTSSTTYKQWLSEPDQTTLWIKGIPGSGKSVVAAHLIDSLSKSYPSQPVLYFFFRQIIDANHEPRALLRDWLDQILEYSPPLQKDLKEVINDHRSLESLSMEDLWIYFKIAVQNLAGRTFCIADALDEMDQGNDDFLQSLASFGASMHGKVKVVITSRPTPLIESSLRALRLLCLRLEEEKVDSDIASYVNSRLGSSSLSTADQHLVRKAIPGRANGIFLYAKLAMDAFLEPQVSPEVVLRALPVDLHAMYTTLLRQHAIRTGIPQDIQLLILQWVTHATRPLRLLELAEIVRVTYVCDQASNERLNLQAAKDLVRTAAGPLLEVLPNETICVIHHSFTEYLKNTDRFENNGGYPILRFGATHARLAQTCVEYLRAGCLDSMTTAPNRDDSDDSNDTSILDECTQSDGFDRRRSNIVNQDQRVKLQYPFYAYAAAFWHFHVRKSCNAGFLQNDINAALEKLFTNTTHSMVWLKFHWTKNEHASRRISPLHIAARFGLTEFARHLQSGKNDVDAVDKSGKTPLWWAAASGHADVIQLLHQSGADPDVDEKDRGLRPLHEAASNNHADAVRVLLEAGVDPLTPKAREDPGRRCGNAPRTTGHTPLMYACKNGHLEALQAFLPFITDIDIAHRALAWSAESGRSKLVQCLLHHPGVNANAKVRSDTILYRSCKRLDRDSIFSLLEAGAEPMNLSVGTYDEFAGMGVVRMGSYAVRAKEDRGYTALHALCGVHQRDYYEADKVDMAVLQEMVEALLAKGVSVDFRTPHGRTALHSAVHSPTLIRLLLQAGADANAVDDEGYTPLHGASLPETIALLLEQGHANIDSILPSDGKSPLLKMLTGYNEDGVLKLLEYCPNMGIRDTNGKGPLHLALSSRLAHISIIKKLLEAGADPDERDHAGDSPLLVLPLDGRETFAIIDLLLGFGADINARNRLGISILIRAARYQARHGKSDDSHIKNLLVRGADLHVRDYNGKSLLHHVVSSHNPETNRYSKEQGSTVLDYLVSLGLDVRCVDYGGNTLLHELALRSDARDTHRGEAPLHIWEQLLRLKLEIDKGNNLKRTVLHMLSAAKYCRDGSQSHTFRRGTAGTLDFVLTRCEDVDQRDVDGLTALHLSSTVSESVTKKLLDAGADPHRKTNDGLTALHLAARARQSNVVGLLVESCKIERPQFIDTQDAKGRSPLYYACRSGVPETVRLLVDAGADARDKTLWLACSEFDIEQTLWSHDRRPADTEANGAAGGLTIDDKTRPGLSLLEKSRQHGRIDDTTRLEEIVEMLMQSGCDMTGLVGGDDFFRSCGAIAEAANSSSKYTLGCLARARDKNSDIKRSRFVSSARFLERVLVLHETALTTAVCEEAQQYGKSDVTWLVENLLESREYEALLSLLKERAILLDKETEQLELFVRRGYSALVDKVVTIESQRHLGQGLGHALGDKSKTGLCNSSDSEPTSQNSLTSKMSFLLLIAVQRGAPNMDVLRLLVEKFHVDVNEFCYGPGPASTGFIQRHTALHELAHGRHWWQVAIAIPYLISKGMDINAKDQMGRTPLHIALGGPEKYPGCFHKDAVRALVAGGANVDERDNRGVSCLASTAGDLEMVKLLLGCKAKITSDAVFMALLTQRTDVLQALLEAGADPNGRLENSLSPNLTSIQQRSANLDGDVPLTEDYPLYFVALGLGAHNYSQTKDERRNHCSNAAQLMQTLLSAGADPFATFSRRTPHGIEEEDAKDNEDDSVKELLRDGRVTKITFEDVLLAHELVGQGNIAHPILILEKLDADRRDAQGRNLLHMACHQHNLDDPIDSALIAIDPEYVSLMPSFIHCLCHRGADPLALDASGNSIFHHMFLSNNCRKTDSKDRSTIKRLAGIYPVLVNQANNQGKTPLLMALKHATLHGTTAAAEALLEAGADARSVDTNGNSGLHILAFSFYDNVKVRDLQAKLLEGGLDINTRNKRGETPLFNLNKYVPRYGGVPKERIGAAEALSMFERAGADLFVRDDSGKTLLHVAAKETQEPFKNTHLERLWHMDPDNIPIEPSVARFQTLLSRGLDPFVEDEGKRTALDVAAAYGKDSVLELFDNQKPTVSPPPVLSGGIVDDDSEFSDW